MLQQLIIIISIVSSAYASNYKITDNSLVVGKNSSTIRGRNTLAQLCEQHGVGFDALLSANPFLRKSHTKANTLLILPHQYILPNIRHGIVINIPAKTLYYFPDKESVMVFPVGIGRKNFESPTGTFWLRDKRHNPTWYVPSSVREEELAKGVSLPKSIPPGEENPLGDYAMRLSYTSILIHGTNDPSGVGKRSTSGCFSMYAKDIAELFSKVPKGTPVTIIDQPALIAENKDQTFLSVYDNEQQSLKVDKFEGNCDNTKIAIAYANKLGIPIQVR